jgi:cytoskeletal protein RodZ
MNQFDQEIKNKINSQSYEYKPQAWKAFKKQSGMPMMSASTKIALVGCAAAIITGSVLFFTLPSNNTPETDNSVIAQEQVSEDKSINQNIDTIEFTEIAEANNTLKSTTNTATPTVTVATRPGSQTPIQAQTPTQPQTQVPTQTKAQPTYYGRPLEILVDTISSIDFPDYETKPADMLP